MNYFLFRIIDAKMAALSALLGNATDAIYWHNWFHYQKDGSMAAALLLAMFADSMQLFFPTNSKIYEHYFEHYQAWAEGLHDFRGLWTPTEDKVLR